MIHSNQTSKHLTPAQYIRNLIVTPACVPMQNHIQPRILVM
jgi:hypothetical protein